MISEYIPKPKKIMLIMLLGFLNFYGLGIAQELEVRFTEQMVLGDDPDAPVEYLFVGPRAIDTDGKGRIYTVGINNTIRVYSPEGKYITSFGGRGRGPGEFLEIGAMSVSNTGEIIINDPRSFRITRFSHLGDTVSTYSLENQNVRQGRQVPQSNIVPLAGGRYATTSKMRDALFGRLPKELDNRVVHVMPSNFSTFEKSMFDVYKYMFDPNQPLERLMATDWNYSLQALPNNRLALTHDIYNGIVYIFNLDTQDSLFQQVEGKFTSNKRYTILHGGSSKYYIRKGYTSFAVKNGPLGKFVYQRNLESEGMFANNQWIINVVSVAEETEIEYFIEVIDSQNGEYIGYLNISDTFNVSDGIRQVFYPMHLDDKNQLYYFDTSAKIPVLRVTKIEVQ